MFRWSVSFFDPSNQLWKSVYWYLVHLTHFPSLTLTNLFLVKTYALVKNNGPKLLQKNKVVNTKMRTDFLIKFFLTKYFFHWVHLHLNSTLWLKEYHMFLSFSTIRDSNVNKKKFENFSRLKKTLFFSKPLFWVERDLKIVPVR